jgi:hypothetical protein
VFIPQLTRPALITAVVLAALIWVFGENFGEIPTGDATDPNSGPLLALFALCFWPLSHAQWRLPGNSPVADAHSASTL